MKNTKIVSLTWQNLCAYADDKKLLNDCSGYCRAGEMLAIMGPSGAGKTTLLSVLCKRYSSAVRVEGSVESLSCRSWRILKISAVEGFINLAVLSIRTTSSSKD